MRFLLVCSKFLLVMIRWFSITTSLFSFFISPVIYISSIYPIIPSLLSANTTSSVPLLSFACAMLVFSMYIPSTIPDKKFTQVLLQIILSPM